MLGIYAKKKGFTIIELLVVIGILVVLLAITLVAINPLQQINKAKDAQRRTGTRELQRAIVQWSLDNSNQMPQSVNGTPIPTGEPGFEISTTSVNICSQLVPQYIAELPVDPTLGVSPVKDCSASYNTGYLVYTGAQNTAKVISSLDSEYPDPALLAWWKMDEPSWVGNCSAADVLDKTGHGYHGKICPNGAGPVRVSGVNGNAASFDGVNDSINPTSNFEYSAYQAFTIAAWFKSNSVATRQGIYNNGHGTSMEIAGSKLSAYVRHTLGWVSVTGSTTLTSGTWYHYAFVYRNNEKFQVYLNGVLDGTSPATVIYNHSGSSDDVIGNTNPLFGNFPFNGSIDNVRIYNKALTQSEISALYRSSQ